MTELAPIVLFVFARPEHTRRTLEALAANHLAKQSDLFIYADGSRGDRDIEAVNDVRTIARNASGFRRCTVVERTSNHGLSRNIIDGVTEICGRYGRVIILEDDIVTSPGFLSFMNDALNRYESDDRIASVHGYVYPVGQTLPDAFFLRGADCWGWATWKRAWSHFDPNGRHLLDELRRRRLMGEFDYNGAYPFSRMLAAQVRGKNDSWAIRWHASVFLADRLTLYPGRSLVRNIGVDNSGTHCDSSAQYDVCLNEDAPCLDGIEVRPSEEARAAIERFFRRGSSANWTDLIRRIKRVFRRWMP